MAGSSSLTLWLYVSVVTTRLSPPATQHTPSGCCSRASLAFPSLSPYANYTFSSLSCHLFIRYLFIAGVYQVLGVDVAADDGACLAVGAVNGANGAALGVGDEDLGRTYAQTRRLRP